MEWESDAGVETEDIWIADRIEMRMYPGRAIKQASLADRKVVEATMRQVNEG